MNDSSRPAAFLIADDRALDLLNSIANPSGTQFEWLANGSDLIDWLEHAQLLQSDDVLAFRKNPSLAVSDAIATKARDLREWFRQFVSRHAGKPLSTSALQELGPVNNILAQEKAYRQIELRDLAKRSQDESSLQWKRHRHWQSANDLLFVVADVIGNLVCSADFSLIKRCEGPTCTLWFYDISKNHSRRWCTMSVCGNRAKAALHRAKKKNRKNISQ